MTTPETMRGRETEMREWEKAWVIAGDLDCDILKNKNGVIYVRQDTVNAHHKALRAKELGEIRERIRNMPKRNLGTNQYEEKYVRWNSFGKEQGVDDFLDELIEKPQ
jgi:hypothetical protein